MIARCLEQRLEIRKENVKQDVIVVVVINICDVLCTSLALKGHRGGEKVKFSKKDWLKSHLLTRNGRMMPVLKKCEQWFILDGRHKGICTVS